MNIIRTYYGQPSYTLGNNLVDVYISVQGGHLTADFKASNAGGSNANTEGGNSGYGKKAGRTISPFFVAPWWKEAPYQNEDEIIKVLRGDFFCLPFGGNDEQYNGRKYPVHGETANRDWDFVSKKTTDEENEIVLSMDLEIGKGSVEKSIKLYKGEPIIYSSHRVSGFTGKAPIGHHPILKFPETEGSGIIDISPPAAGFTTPVPIEDPALGGYSRIKPGEEIKDFDSVPCTDGSMIDISRYPTSFGFEDIVIYINDPSRDFVYSAVSFPSKGYLYFQLKNPKVLAETLLWMSNGGRHYAPWNSRVRAVLGLEEISGFYHYGIKASLSDNFLMNRGYKTYTEFTENKPTNVSLIMGVVPVGDDFKGVKDIVKKNSSTVTVIGKGGEQIDVPCRVDFLAG